MVFVTSKDAKNVSVEDAESYILGYTTGNDLSCRLFQMPDNSGGQFFYAKAFDKFAPIGPILVSAQKYQSSAAGRRLRTRVNGEVVQDVEIAEDMVFTPAQILSHMSQGELFDSYVRKSFPEADHCDRHNDFRRDYGYDRDCSRCWRFQKSQDILAGW